MIQAVDHSFELPIWFYGVDRWAVSLAFVLLALAEEGHFVEIGHPNIDIIGLLVAKDIHEEGRWSCQIGYSVLNSCLLRRETCRVGGQRIKGVIHGLRVVQQVDHPVACRHKQKHLEEIVPAEASLLLLGWPLGLLDCRVLCLGGRNSVSV